MAKRIELLGKSPKIAEFGPGRHGDGAGLSLLVDRGPDGSGVRHRWVSRTADGKGGTRSHGLGPALGPGAITIRQARELNARTQLEAKATRSTPSTGTTAHETSKLGTFCDAWWRTFGTQFRSPVHRAAWERSLRVTFRPLHDKPIDEIGVSDVVDLLRPYWTTKRETAKRDRERLEKVLSAAASAGLRDASLPNPAAWRDVLEHHLPKQGRVTRHANRLSAGVQ